MDLGPPGMPVVTGDLRILFCADPLALRRPDPSYAAEVAAVADLRASYGLIQFEALLEGDVGRALRRVPAWPAGTTALYRGWMLGVPRYRLLYAGLAERGIRLLNDPAAYAHTHLLPNSYDIIAAHTPRTVWLPTDGPVDLDQIMDRLRPFGTRPVIVKDYVKSRKHEWLDACFIPSAADRAAVERVVRRFLDLQGDDLTGGLVFREYVALEPAGRHPRSGMPLSQEYRRFYLDGQPLYGIAYWAEAAFDEPPPPPPWLPGVAAAVRSRFFTIDLARRADGGWLIVELGDGQVAGLPAHADVTALYRGLAERWGDSATGG